MLKSKEYASYECAKGCRRKFVPVQTCCWRSAPASLDGVCSSCVGLCYVVQFHVTDLLWKGVLYLTSISVRSRRRSEAFARRHRAARRHVVLRLLVSQYHRRNFPSPFVSMSSRSDHQSLRLIPVLRLIMRESDIIPCPMPQTACKARTSLESQHAEIADPKFSACGNWIPRLLGSMPGTCLWIK